MLQIPTRGVSPQRRSDVETLCDEEPPWAQPSSIPERAEVSGYRADIMRNERPLLLRCQRQDSEVFHVAQASHLSRQEIQRGLAPKNSPHDGFVKIGIRQIPDFQDWFVICNSFRTRISLSPNWVGSGSASRFPSTHFWS